jgi:NhaP-type Na+/H+ or K+/H+ antiporter
MIRGVITGVYPYDFINPNRYGYGDVLLTVVQILVFGVAVGLVLWGVDWLLLRRMKSTSP